MNSTGSPLRLRAFHNETTTHILSNRVCGAVFSPQTVDRVEPEVIHRADQGLSVQVNQ
jgi:hypothetical protein